MFILDLKSSVFNVFSHAHTSQVISPLVLQVLNMLFVHILYLKFVCTSMVWHQFDSNSNVFLLCCLLPEKIAFNFHEVGLSFKPPSFFKHLSLFVLLWFDISLTATQMCFYFAVCCRTKFHYIFMILLFLFNILVSLNISVCLYFYGLTSVSFKCVFTLLFAAIQKFFLLPPHFPLFHVSLLCSIMLYYAADSVSTFCT